MLLLPPPIRTRDERMRATACCCAMLRIRCCAGAVHAALPCAAMRQHARAMRADTPPRELQLLFAARRRAPLTRLLKGAKQQDGARVIRRRRAMRLLLPRRTPACCCVCAKSAADMRSGAHCAHAETPAKQDVAATRLGACCLLRYARARPAFSSAQRRQARAAPPRRRASTRINIAADMHVRTFISQRQSCRDTPSRFYMSPRACAAGSSMVLDGYSDVAMP